MELVKQCKRLDSEMQKEPLIDATKESGKVVSNAIKQKLSNLWIFLGITVLFGVIIFFIARRKGK